MAARSDEVGYDQLHHFVAAGVWDSGPLEAALLKEADRLVGDAAGFLVIDDTALPKKERHSVGVAPQYASALGKTANCQSLVSVKRAGVPKERQVTQTKPEIAIDEIDRVIASGARFGCVLADAGYGSSGSFRQALSERGLQWAEWARAHAKQSLVGWHTEGVGLPRHQNVYPADVDLMFPVAKVGKRRQYHIPNQPPASAETRLPQRHGKRSPGGGAPKGG